MSCLATLSKKTYLLYLILLLAAGSVLLHYHWTGLPAVYYLLFTTVSVVWQDYLTFGFLQNYLRQLFSFKKVLILLAALFILAYLFYVSHFWNNPFLLVLTALMALLLTYLREKTQTLHWLIFLHLLFYFVIA